VKIKKSDSDEKKGRQVFFQEKIYRGDAAELAECDEYKKVVSFFSGKNKG